MGSVKKLNVSEHPTSVKTGEGYFIFSDDYSVFDWGKMPDSIPKKGSSLCIMGAYNFELLEEEGIPTHYKGVVENNEVKKLEEVSKAADTMAVELTQVPPLNFENGEYDYKAFHKKGGTNYLIPLEIIFRNSVPVGSSLRKRRNPSDLGLDIESWPEESVELQDAIVEFSTKFEEKDRYVDEEEALKLSGLDESEFNRLKDIAVDVNKVITEKAEDVGLSHEDGKIECLYYNGDILVADVVGTFDENRFLYKGEQLSKEFIRQYYKKYDPEWVNKVSEAKKEADEKDIADWRKLCDVQPKPLPADVVASASKMYASGCNRYTEENWFECPTLPEVLEEILRKKEFV